MPSQEWTAIYELLMRTRPALVSYDSAEAKASDLSAYLSMLDVLEGDYDRLCSRLRSKAKLREDERAFIADFLEGKLKRPPHRMTRQKVKAKQVEVARFICICERVREWPREAAVQQAMSLYRVSRRYAFEALKKLRADPESTRATEVFAEIIGDLKSGKIELPDPACPNDRNRTLRLAINTPLLYRSADKADLSAP